MSDGKITQEELEDLLEMLKRSLVESIILPEVGEKIKFDVESCASKEPFKIQVYRSKMRKDKYELCGLVAKNNIPLLELHINPTKKHQNPDGTMIEVSHWHIFTEEYGRKMAFPAEELESEDFVKNTIKFLERFNVVEKPKVTQKLFLMEGGGR